MSLYVKTDLPAGALRLIALCESLPGVITLIRCGWPRKLDNRTPLKSMQSFFPDPMYPIKMCAKLRTLPSIKLLFGKRSTNRLRCCRTIWMNGCGNTMNHVRTAGNIAMGKRRCRHSWIPYHLQKRKCCSIVATFQTKRKYDGSSDDVVTSTRNFYTLQYHISQWTRCCKMATACLSNSAAKALKFFSCSNIFLLKSSGGRSPRYLNV